MKKVIFSLAALAVALLGAADASALDYNLPLQQQLDLFADSLMRPGTFVMQGYMNPDCGHELRFAVTGLMENEGYTVQTDSAGKFSMTVPMEGPMQEIYLYRNKTITLPVYPGDTINLDIEKNSVAMSGATPEATRDLQFASLVYDRFRQRINNFPKMMRGVPRESFNKNCPDSLTKPLVDEAEAICCEWEALQDSVEKAGGPLRSSTYYKYSGYVSPQVYILSEELHKAVDVRASDNPILKIRPYSLIPSTDMVYPPVRMILNDVVRKASRDVESVMLVFVFSDRNKDLSLKSAELRRLIAKDDFLADWLDIVDFKYNVRHWDVEKADSYYRYLKETVREPAFQQYIDSLAAGVDKVRPGTPAPSISLIGTDGKKYTLDDFKGKIVYLDFWSVGCGPCYSEFRTLPELKEAYKDYLDKIEFVTVICGEPAKETWLNLIDRHKLNHEVNTMLDVKGSDPLYNVKSYPTYILIDAEGRFVKYGAQRPSLMLQLKKNGFPGTDFDKALGILSQQM